MTDFKHHELNQLTEERSFCTHGSSFDHLSIKNHDRTLDGLKPCCDSGKMLIERKKTLMWNC